LVTRFTTGEGESPADESALLSQISSSLPVPDGTLLPEWSGTQFIIGDINADGFSDFIVGDSWFKAGHIFLGRSDLPAEMHIMEAPFQMVFSTPLRSLPQFAAMNLDNDAREDLALLIQSADEENRENLLLFKATTLQQPLITEGDAEVRETLAGSGFKMS